MFFAGREMAARSSAKGSPVVINMTNPGLYKSELAREGNFSIHATKFLLARGKEVWSRNLMLAAGMGEESHGKYSDKGRVEQPASVVVGKGENV